MNPYFTVVIPTLNEEEHLPLLLSSLMSQSYKDFEVVIVDGNSKDSTNAIINKHVHLFKNQGIVLQQITSEVRNAAYQRNSGAKKAKGEYLVFFDADVSFNNEYLSKLYGYIKNHKDSLFTTSVKADKNGLYEMFIQILVNLLITVSIVIKKPVSLGFNTIVKKDVFFDVGGFNPHVNVMDDHDFSLRAFQKGYPLCFYKNITITFSLRRFRKGGWLKTLYKYIKITIYALIYGVPKSKVFVYPMGGHVHKK